MASHRFAAERRELAQRRLLEVTRKWELDISSSKRRPATSSGNDYSWLHKTDKSLREERIRATGGSKGAYNQRTDGCELGKGKSYLNSPRFSFGSSSRFSEK